MGLPLMRDAAARRFTYVPPALMRLRIHTTLNGRHLLVVLLAPIPASSDAAWRSALWGSATSADITPDFP